jgi:2-amino-4-hydroxy-6-hydroxymethyldihydropteridine diphosphokinase
VGHAQPHRKGQIRESVKLILIGLGANLPSTDFGPPQSTLEAALAEFARQGIEVVRRSRWYRSAPVPPSDQPWFINAVAAVVTERSPADVLTVLHRIEAKFGRTRRTRDEARVIDLDLLAYGDRVQGDGEGPQLPHPRLHARAFVLLPLAEVAPGWRHPLLGKTVEDLIAELPPGQVAERLD